MTQILQYKEVQHVEDEKKNIQPFKRFKSFLA